MKNFKLVNGALAIVVSFLSFSCSFDDTTTVKEESTNLIQTTNENTSRSRTAFVLIEWHAEVTEQRKTEVRDKYKGEKILIWHEICNDPKFETWNVSCPRGCNKQTDTPVDTDDDVKKTVLHYTCLDL